MSGQTLVIQIGPANGRLRRSDRGPARPDDLVCGDRQQPTGAIRVIRGGNPSHSQRRVSRGRAAGRDGGERSRRRPSQPVGARCGGGGSGDSGGGPAAAAVVAAAAASSSSKAYVNVSLTGSSWSVPVKCLRSLLEEVDKDVREWICCDNPISRDTNRPVQLDGKSYGYAEFFQQNKIDTKVHPWYSKYYLNQRHTIAGSYVWPSGRI